VWEFGGKFNDAEKLSIGDLAFLVDGAVAEALIFVDRMRVLRGMRDREGNQRKETVP
jgi:hypothetical protein